MISITNKSNYLARVVTLPALRKHSNADRLQCVSILGNNVITGLTAKEGELYVYFPLECAINTDFLKFTNSFANPEDNADGKTKGFFGHHGRVKALKLRGERSEGYIVPVTEINRWLGTEAITYLDDGQDFDSVNGKILCEKYINRQELIDAEKAARADNKRNKKTVRTSKLVENQFRLSPDTEALKRNMHKIKPDDIITISYKYHGCNTSIGKVICRKPLTFWNRVAKFLGAEVVETHTDLVYASRRVVKNAYADKQSAHYYDTDVWGHIADIYKDAIKPGVTLYGEIVGKTPTGQWIQKDYDYGTDDKAELIVYRITLTNGAGDVFEFSTNQVTDYCKKMGLKRAEVFYHGVAKDLFPNVTLDDHWHDNYLKALSDKYLEGDCHICKNKVPAEGVVLTRDGDYFEPFKLKAFRFLERESKELDSGTVNIEETN
jgi:RNA ligase